jgi:tetratricopeptide (TPR) repeat protein
MNIVKIYGGLGNQLFQYAFGKVQKENGIRVKYDLSWFKKSQPFPRPYILDKFQTNVKISTSTSLPRYKEKEFDPYIFDLDGFYFCGYWQYAIYYKDLLPELRKEFRVKPEYLTEEYFRLKEDIIINNSISLHVRRGDLLVNTRDYAQTLDYYKRALEEMRDFNDGKVFIFSDDIVWCKENFKDVTFVSLNDYLDFELMSFCKHNIITNSTFSWWASFLNDNSNKTIIAPKMWRSDSNDQKKFEKGLYLPNWIIV